MPLSLVQEKIDKVLPVFASWDNHKPKEHEMDRNKGVRYEQVGRTYLDVMAQRIPLRTTCTWH